MTPPARLIAEWTPLKVSRAWKSNIIWLRRQKASTRKPKDTLAVMEFVLGVLIAGALMPVTRRILHRENSLKGATLSEIGVKGLSSSESCLNHRFLAQWHLHLHWQLPFYLWSLVAAAEHSGKLCAVTSPWLCFTRHSLSHVRRSFLATLPHVETPAWVITLVSVLSGEWRANGMKLDTWAAIAVLIWFSSQTWEVYSNCIHKLSIPRPTHPAIGSWWKQHFWT